MRAHHALVAFGGRAFADDLAFGCYLAEVDFAVVAVADAGDEELELLFVGGGSHDLWTVEEWNVR